MASSKAVEQWEIVSGDFNLRNTSMMNGSSALSGNDLKRRPAIQAVILCGGLAARLGDLTTHQPKSLVRVLDKPFIEYQIDLLKKQGIGEMVLCIGHLGEQIQDYLRDGRKQGISITYSFENTRLGTGGALRNASNLLHDEFVTIYGDSYLNINYNALMAYFQDNSKIGLMTVYKNHNQHEKSNVSISGGLVRKYSKIRTTGKMVYVDYGAHCFRKNVLKMIPPTGFYPLEDLFQDLVSREELLSYRVYNRFFEIGSRQGICDFEKYVKSMEVN